MRSSSLPGTRLGGRRRGGAGVTVGGRGLGADRFDRAGGIGGVSPVVRLPALLLGQPQLAHGQELEHPVLDVAEAVVVLVEDLLRPLDVEVLLAPFAPRQLGDRLEVGADDLRFHRLAAHARQPGEFAVDLLLHLRRQLEGVELAAQLLEVAALVALAQLLLDGLQLLAQVHLPLAVAQLLLNLRLDRRLGVEHADLTLDADQHPPQPLLDRERLEQPLPLGRRQLRVAGDQVGELSGVVDVVEHLLDHLFGQTGLPAQLRGPLSRFAVEPDERRIVRVERLHLLGFAHDRLEIAVRLADLHGDSAVLAADDELGTSQPSLDLDQPGDGADGVEHLGRGVLHVLPLRHGEQQLVGALHHRLDRPHRRGPASGDRDGDAGEQHRVAQGQHRQGQALGHQRLLPRQTTRPKSHKFPLSFKPVQPPDRLPPLTPPAGSDTIRPDGPLPMNRADDSRLVERYLQGGEDAYSTVEPGSPAPPARTGAGSAPAGRTPSRTFGWR